MTDNLPATTGDVSAPVIGLEDVGVGTTRPPIIRIDHSDVVYEDQLTGEKFESMKVIILGLVKQRVMWDTEISGDDKTYPLCRSVDFRTGYPTNQFPWTHSNFEAPADLDNPGALACANCKFKEWDSTPNRTGPPWCTEQHTFIILQEVKPEVWSPALITLQRSAIANSNKYVQGFVRAKDPMFKFYTDLRLEAKKRGKNTYGVPQFVKGAETDSDLWGAYADTYLAIRELITSPRSDESAREDDEEEAVVMPATNASKKGSNEVIVVPEEDEEIPF